jgi:hypothetical protein
MFLLFLESWRCTFPLCSSHGILGLWRLEKERRREEGGRRNTGRVLEIAVS